MRKRYHTSARQLVFAFIVLLIAYAAFTGRQPTIFLDEQGGVVGTYDLTVLFRIVFWSALVIGLLLVRSAIQRLFANEVDQGQSHLSPPRFGRWFSGNAYGWVAFNSGLILLGLWTGSGETFLDTLSVARSGIIVCVSIVILVPAFVIGSVSLAATEHFQTPGWSRFPLNWSKDPLQALFIMTWCTLAAVLGGLSRLGSSGSGGVWSIAAYVSLLFGLLMGQAMVYRIFRGRISHSERNTAIECE